MLPGAATDPDKFVRAMAEFSAARDRYRALKAENPAAAAADTTLRDLLVGHFHESERSALCFSGGGVRSATFSLGVLEGLSRYSWVDTERPAEAVEPKLLAEFDFLSTVSGGGYTGGWFSSWAAREHDSARVVKALASKRTDELDPEPSQVRYLRNYASFLNPKLGFTSADTWTLLATIFRNIALNWMVLLPLLAAVLVLPRLFKALVLLPVTGHVPAIAVWCVPALAFAATAISSAYMIDDLPKAGNARHTQRAFLIACLGALCVSGGCMLLFWSWHLYAGGGLSWWSGIVYTDLALLAGVALATPPSVKRRGKDVNMGWMLKGVIGLLVSGALGGFLAQRALLAFSDFGQRQISDPQLYSWLGLPILIAVFGVFQLVLVGVTSKYTEDEDREWWARCAAWFTIVLLGWLIASGLVLYATDFFRWSQLGVMHLTGATTLTGAVLSLLGFSPKSNSRGTEENNVKIWSLPLPAKIRELAIQMILPVFFILLIMTFAAIDENLAQELPKWAGLTDMYLLQAHSRAEWLVAIARSISAWETDSVPMELLLLLLLAVPSLVASRFVNANTFSLHAMYRSRLIRTFLGASNPEGERAEEVNPFTGFAQKDNVTMASLANIRTKKPLHVVNAALNLVKGDKLAWQQRKAESFTISPLHSGSLQVGYVPSSAYARANHKTADGTSGVSLGGAITISGAAASPNMGYHSSPLLTMIMTLFNARLGAWLPNPGPAGRGYWTKEAPDYTFTPFVDEAFGLTTDTNAWVYLSDGGHFENLGLYEMVLRRCHNIIVVDGGADPDYSYEDLGNAVRKIRIDLGIPIEFPYGIPISKTHDKDGKHCAWGVIEYSCVDPAAADGRIVYIKTSLNGNEPPDILNYARQNHDFPQQPTQELWFEEAQFESYRRLGSHVVDELCGGNDVDRRMLSVDDFFDRVEKKYLAVHPAAEEGGVAGAIRPKRQ